MNRQAKNIRRQSRIMRPCLLASAVALALTANQASAIDLSTDNVSIQLDTTISYGIGFRASERDDDLVAKAFFNPLIFAAPIEQQIAATGRFSANSDDGNLNFDQWDPIFNQARVTSELSIGYQNFGAFVRGNYFYDFTLSDEDFLSEGAKDQAAERARLLDAYIYGDFDMPGGRLLSMRLGRQVVSWGESTFLPGGINAINPVDITAIRTAGAELRDAFLPLNMLWASMDITPNLSAEAVAMFEWDAVEAEPSGTFFATNDFATEGGRYAMLNFGLVPQPIRNTDLFGPVCGQGQFGLSDTGLPPALVAVGCSAAFPRRPQDTEASDSGQYGIALRYFAPWLNDTEFGLYYLRYHSRLPVLSGQAVTSPDVTTGQVIVEYPEDIDLFGLSFNTTVAGFSVGGEVSYRDNLPIQIDDVELLFAGLSPLNAALPSEYDRFRSQLGQYAPGEFIPGYERQPVSQAQVTLTRLIGPNNPIGADQLAFVTEVGATHFWDLPDHEQLRFDGPGTDTGGGPSIFNGGNGRNPVTLNEGFATAFSWGYRLVLAPTYNSVFGTPWSMTPRLAFNHDVQGISPGPGGNFIAGRKQATVGVQFNYLAQWRVDFAYTNFFGAGINNLLGDRDFVSGSVSYSF